MKEYFIFRVFICVNKLQILSEDDVNADNTIDI